MSNGLTTFVGIEKAAGILGLSIRAARQVLTRLKPLEFVSHRGNAVFMWPRVKVEALAKRLKGEK